ncbi:hypothetical protein CLG94_02830 [Candidatus Methylomirabilis limnetica]|uniref:Nucleotidyltransferase n=1 Tax=Candidatus Methylomirabilis limnetica TaxID=2033718 RepID=A0A2T4TZX1_9BACT|nr:HepT-like ribonuclease domain-containing protein [Candidatus Methylomirabilis limnetica]PTL36631.1 hypothetical protein CLG94_02830 [Candidatus Methylomirabilis limnetica]
MEDELLKYLYDIREAASAILRFVRGKTFDEYEQDELLRSGVERKFEILGEALNRIRKDDVVFQTDRPDLFITAMLKQDLEAFLNHPVDVVRLRDTMNPRLKARIEREAIYV